MKFLSVFPKLPFNFIVCVFYLLIIILKIMSIVLLYFEKNEWLYQ